MARQSPTVRAAWIAGFFGVAAAIIVGASGFFGPGPAERNDASPTSVPDVTAPHSVDKAQQATTSGDRSPVTSGDRNVIGDQNLLIDRVEGSVTINPAPKTVTRTVLTPGALFREVRAGDNSSRILAPENLLGYVTSEAEVRVLSDAVVETGDILLPSLTKVEILSGELAGKVGWVRTGSVAEVKGAE